MPWQPFTKDTAKAASLKGAAALRAKRDVVSRLDALAARLAKLERNGHSRHKPQTPAPVVAPPPLTLHDAPNESPEAFALSRLERVRVLLVDIDRRLSVETDPLAIDRLGRAAKTLHDQFLDLSGHSRAGQRRPGRESRLPAKPLHVGPLGRATEEADDEPACEQVSGPPSSTAALPVEPAPVPLPGDSDDPPPED